MAFFGIFPPPTINPYFIRFIYDRIKTIIANGAKILKTAHQKITDHVKKTHKFTSPEQLHEWTQFLPDPAALLGINRVTLARWLSGESRIPFAAAQLLRLLHGELPRHFGVWAGWRLDAGGEIFPPGWGSGLLREDVLDVWKFKQEAVRSRGLEIENVRLRRDLAFFRRDHEEKAPLAFARALVDVVNEL